MEIVIVVVVMLLLLLLIKEVIQPLHALISVMFSFCFWHVVLDTFIAFRQTTVRNTCVFTLCEGYFNQCKYVLCRAVGGIASGRT